MQSRLLQSIKDQPIEILREFKVGADAKETLRQACTMGRIDVVIYLLNAGVQVQGISDTSIVDRFPLLAKILGACGAFHQPNDPEITEGMCFRAYSQNEPHLVQRVATQESFPHALAALAFENKNERDAKFLLESKPGKQLEKDPYRCTAGYWAAVNRIDMLELACTDTQEWVMTLAQLSHDAKYEEWEIVYRTAMKKDTSIDDKFFNFEHETGGDKLLLTASRAKMEELKKSAYSLDALSSAFIYAHQKRNYIALKTILACCDPIPLLIQLIQQGQERCALFLLAAGNVNFFELGFACRNKQVPNNLTRMCWGSDQNLDEFLKPVQGFDSVSAWTTQKRIAYLNQQVTVLSLFVSSLESEIEAKPCYASRIQYTNNCVNAHLLMGFLLFAGVIIAAYPREDLDDPGLRDSQGPVSWGFIALAFLLECILGPSFRQNIAPLRGRVRFHQLSLNDYSEPIRSAAQMIAAEFAETKSSLSDMALDNRVCQVLPNAKQLMIERTNELQTLNAFLERRIDVRGTQFLTHFSIYSLEPSQSESNQDPLLMRKEFKRRGSE